MLARNVPQAVMQSSTLLSEKDMIKTGTVLSLHLIACAAFLIC